MPTEDTKPSPSGLYLNKLLPELEIPFSPDQVRWRVTKTNDKKRGHWRASPVTDRRSLCTERRTEAPRPRSVHSRALFHHESGSKRCPRYKVDGWRAKPSDTGGRVRWRELRLPSSGMRCCHPPLIRHRRRNRCGSFLREWFRNWQSRVVEMQGRP